MLTILQKLWGSCAKWKGFIDRKNEDSLKVEIKRIQENRKYNMELKKSQIEKIKN